MNTRKAPDLRAFHPMLSRRSYTQSVSASSWEEIWEAGPYYDRISELLEDAQHYAVLVGWQIDSRLPMKRPPRNGEREPRIETLREKVIRLCEAKPDFQFFFLMWDHAYFYVLEREAWQGRIWEDVHPRVHFIFDNRHPLGASHHEKVAIIDGKIGFCGGIDLCDDRWDSPNHFYFDPRRSLSWKSENHGPYHDLAVQVTGQVVGVIQAHVARRWGELSSIPFPAPEPTGEVHGGHRVYVSRTQAGVDAGATGTPIVREIEFLYRDLIESAEHQILIEGQYYWSRQIHDLLEAKIHRMRGRRDFKIIVVLADLKEAKSFTRHLAPYEHSLLERLEKAARISGIDLVIGTPVVSAPQGEPHPPKPVYIHSKLMVIDDRYLSIGSANFTSRALRIDTEVNLTLEANSEPERAHIRRVALEALRHWTTGDIRLRPIEPPIPRGLLDLLPLHRYFDPPVPWFYPLKRRYRGLVKRQSSLIFLGVLLLVSFGASGAILLSGAETGKALFYSTLLSTVWLLPIPFVPIALLASLVLGPETAARLAASALAVAATLGYALARAFPTPAARFYRRTATPGAPERLGLRNFPMLVSVLADPRA
ncbi:MAG: phospholipase D-like domain-containing protein, partial [Bdellovibrionota bacterium]